MTNAEITNKAKETSGGNYYYEQGFIYGFELGEENGRKELEKEKCELLGIIQKKDEVIAELKEQNENKREEIKMLRNEHKQDMVIHNNYVNKVEELKAHCKAVDEVNDKMKNCMNCRNVMADDEGVCADCDIENGWKNWEFGE